MNNQDYVQTLNIDAAAQQRCLEAMGKYGENHWWEKDADPHALAYYQFHEPISLVEDFGRFKAAMDLLLGRSTWTHEYISEEFAKLIDTAWQQYQSTK